MKLKVKDLKLLVSLFQDSRKSNRQIAKDIGVSKETVASRIQHFEDIGVIKAFSLKTNYDKLDFKEFNLYVRLKNTTPKTLDKIIKSLVDHPNTTWIGKTFGRFDLRIAFILKDYQDINRIISELYSDFGKHLEAIEYLYVVDKFKASSKLFLENTFGKETIKGITIPHTKKIEDIKSHSYQLDKIDKYIIYELSQNSKETYAKIGIQIGLTAEAIKYRVKKLESNKYINGSSIVLDGAKFGKIWCSVLLNINPKQINEFKEFLKEKHFLSNYTETIGTWNFTTNLFANNIEELYHSLNEIRNKFSEDINNFDFLLIFDFYKFPKIPLCIRE